MTSDASDLFGGSLRDTPRPLQLTSLTMAAFNEIAAAATAHPDGPAQREAIARQYTPILHTATTMGLGAEMLTTWVLMIGELAVTRAVGGVPVPGAGTRAVDWGRQYTTPTEAWRRHLDACARAAGDRDGEGMHRALEAVSRLKDPPSLISFAASLAISANLACAHARVGPADIATFATLATYATTPSRLSVAGPMARVMRAFTNRPEDVMEEMDGLAGVIGGDPAMILDVIGMSGQAMGAMLGDTEPVIMGVDEDGNPSAMVDWADESLEAKLPRVSRSAALSMRLAVAFRDGDETRIHAQMDRAVRAYGNEAFSDLAAGMLNLLSRNLFDLCANLVACPTRPTRLSP